MGSAESQRELNDRVRGAFDHPRIEKRLVFNDYWKLERRSDESNKRDGREIRRQGCTEWTPSIRRAFGIRLARFVAPGQTR